MKFGNVIFNGQQFLNFRMTASREFLADCTYCKRCHVSLVDHKCPIGSMWKNYPGYIENYMKKCDCVNVDSRSLTVSDCNDPPGVVGLLECTSCGKVLGRIVL